MAAVTIRQTVSIRKACELAAVSRRTIYNWMEKGRVSYVKTAGGSRRILLDSLFVSGNISLEPQTVRVRVENHES